MLSRVKAKSPAAMNTITLSTMIGRRVKPNSRMGFNKTGPAYQMLHRQGCSIGRARQQLVAEEKCTVGDNQVAGLDSLDDLRRSSLAQADFHRSFLEVPAVRRQPYRHGAVALAYERAVGDGCRLDGTRDTDGEVGEHPGTQEAIGILDLRPHHDAPGLEIDHGADDHDRALEPVVRI